MYESNKFSLQLTATSGVSKTLYCRFDHLVLAALHFTQIDILHWVMRLGQREYARGLSILADSIPLMIKSIFFGSPDEDFNPSS